MTSKTVHHQPVPAPEKGPNDALLPVQPAEAAAPDISVVEAPALPEAVALDGHAYSPSTAPRAEATLTERKGFWTRRKVVAVFLAAGAILGVGGAVIGLSRGASAESVATPAASGPAVPGNTSRQPSTTTTTNSPEASANTSTATRPATSSSAEATKYVRKNSLLQVSADEAFEQWGVPSAAKISTLVKSASTPEAAVAAARAADKDDLANYVESWLYGQEGVKTNDFIDKVYTQNPKAFPASLLDKMNLVGPGKETLSSPQDIVNDFNVRLIIASRIAQEETMSTDERKKAVAVVLWSMEAPGVTYNPNETSSKYSYMLPADYEKVLFGIIDAKQGNAPQLVPMLALDETFQSNLGETSFKANMDYNLNGTGAHTSTPVEIEVVGVRLDGDKSDKKSVAVIFISTKDGDYTFERMAKYTGQEYVEAGGAKNYVANVLNEDTKKPLFSQVVKR